MSTFSILILTFCSLFIAYVLIKTLINGVYLMITLKPGNVYEQKFDNSRNPFFVIHDITTCQVLDIKKRYVNYLQVFTSERNGTLTYSYSRNNSCHILLFCFYVIMGFKQIKK